MILQSLFNKAGTYAGKLRTYWERIKEAHIIADEPEECDYVTRFGEEVDYINRETGLAPEDIKKELDLWKAFGIDTSKMPLPDLLEKFRSRGRAMGLDI